MFVKDNEDTATKKLHFSHLHHYVSAYELSPERVKQLWDDLQVGLRLAKEETRPVIVDQDGEHFFLCSPSGSFDLCIRWKSFRVLEEQEDGK